MLLSGGRRKIVSGVVVVLARRGPRAVAARSMALCRPRPPEARATLLHPRAVGACSLSLSGPRPPETLAGDTTTAEAVAGDTTTAEAVAGDTTIAEAVAGDTNTAEAVAGDTNKAEAVAGDTTTAEAVAGDTTTAEAVAGDTTTAEAKAGDTTTAEAVAGDTTTAEAKAGDTTTAEAVVGETTTAEAKAGDTTTAEAVAGDTTTAEAKAGDTTTAEAKAGDTTTAEAVAGDTTTAEAKAGDTTTAEAKAGDTTTAEAKAGDTTTAEAVAGDTTTAEAKAGDTTTAEAKAGDTTTAEAVAGDTTTAEAKAGDTTTAEAKAGDTTTAEAVAGDTTTAEAKAGDTTTAEAVAGDTTTAEAKAGDTTTAKAVAGDTTTAEAKAGDTTTAEAVAGDTTTAEAKAGDTTTAKAVAGDTTIADHYDIVVSGGGMVGFAMACSLGQSKRLNDRRILLLEGAPNNAWSLPEDFSNRVCALSRHTQKLFQKLGAWDNITQMRVQPVRRMQVWEACSEAMITFDEQDQEDLVAHIVENDIILHAIKAQVPNCVEVEYSAKVEGYKLPSDSSSKVTVSLQDGRTLTADLLIGADGANSLVRQSMGVQYLSWEYDQMGIVATLQLSEVIDNTVAWQRFLPTGPVALLPLSEDKSSLVWSTTKSNARDLLKLSDEEFTEALNRAIWDDSGTDQMVQSVHERWLKLLETFLPACGADIRQLPPSVSTVVPNSRGAFPLGLGHAVHYVAPRVALIGDAAHRVHPLAGQGVNLGFGDVASLLGALENAVLLGAEMGEVQILHNYESERQKHNVATMAATDGLYRLYKTTAPPLVLLRSLGLSAVNVITPLKRRVLQHAEG